MRSSYEMNRRLALAGLAVTLATAACRDESRARPPPPPPPAPRVDSIGVSPSFVELRSGSTRAFDVVLVGTGLSTPAVAVAVEGIPGGNASVGTARAEEAAFSTVVVYTAPATPPIPNVVTLRVTSVDAPARSASARIVLLATPGSVTVQVAPSTIDLRNGEQQRFEAVVTGTADARVRWDADGGTIDAEGVFTAPSSGFCRSTVTATSLVDPTAKGSATVRCIPDDPVLTSISPDRANAREIVVLSGTSLFYETEMRVVFSGEQGIPIVTRGRPAQNGSSISVGVPFGAVTGPVHVEAVFASRVVRSNSVPFTRLPRLRVLPSARDVAAGESVPIHARALGGPPSVAITWSADVGEVSTDGTYTAPAIVSSETIATVTGCIEESTQCQTAHLRVHPMRIDPISGLVSLGGTLVLDARRGGSSLAPTWELWGPAGTLSAAGEYTAGTTLDDGGNVAIRASESGESHTAWVGVIGGFPGEVGRIHDYPVPADDHFEYADFAVGAGTRLYAVFVGEAQPAASQETFFLDVYDASDPARPVWIDSIEPVTRPMDMWVDADRLYMVNNGVDTVDHYPVVAAYDISTGAAVLAAYEKPDIPWRPLPYYAGGIRNGNVLSWCLPYAPGDTVLGCGAYEAATGERVDYQLPVPPG